MIHLDANFLIGSVNQHSPPAVLLRNWLRHGEFFAASAVAWAEFMHGPVRSDQIQQVEYLIQGNVVSFGRQEAEISSQLFNQTGRRRGSQPDCFIAATAICANARLATRNQKHFMPYVAAGLRLA
jgi:predicted nucleic acid-binding protein